MPAHGHKGTRGEFRSGCGTNFYKTVGSRSVVHALKMLDFTSLQNAGFAHWC